MRLPLLIAALLSSLAPACTQDDAYQKGEPASGEEPADRRVTPPPAKPAAKTDDPPPAKQTAPATPPATATTTSPGTPRAKPATRPPNALSIKGVSASVVPAAQAENALGKQVAPPAGGAVAVDIQFELLPGRALDPVLEIAGARFRRYQTLPGGVLRYVIAGRDLAQAGEVVLRWGSDVLVVADKLVVSP